MDRGDNDEVVRRTGEEEEEEEEQEEEEQEEEHQEVEEQEEEQQDDEEQEDEVGGEYEDDEEELEEISRRLSGLERRGAGDFSLVGYAENVRQLLNLRRIAVDELVRLARDFPDEESSDEETEDEVQVRVINLNDGYETDVEDNDEDSISGSY